MNRTVCLIIAATLAYPTAVLAQNRGSVEDQLACTPDVYRLCGQYIPDEDAIVGCLTKRKPELSAGCKAVFSRPLPPRTKGADQDD